MALQKLTILLEGEGGGSGFRTKTPHLGDHQIRRRPLKGLYPSQVSSQKEHRGAKFLHDIYC